MRSIAAWLAVTGFFVVINALAAGLLFGVFHLGKRFAPALMEESIFVVPLGLVAIALTAWVAIIATQRLSRARARA